MLLRVSCRLALVAGLACAACSSSPGLTASTGSSSTHRPTTAAAASSSGTSGTGTSGTTTGGSSSSTGGTSGSGTTSGGIHCEGYCAPTESCVHNQCVQCTNDSQCNPPEPYCVTDAGASFGRCVQCLASADCDAGFACEPSLSDPGLTLCVFNCNLSDTCTAPSPYCEPDSGTCVTCLSTSQCQNAYLCVPPGSCDPCTSAPQECATAYPDLPYCAPEGTCVQCLTSSDCDGGGNCAGFACQ
jgi:hypothetical protein